MQPRPETRGDQPTQGLRFHQIPLRDPRRASHALDHQPRLSEDQPVRDALRELAGQWPTYGYRRLTRMLHRQGHRVNAKRVRRLMHEMGICGEAPVRQPRTTDSDHAFPRYPNLVEGLEVNRPDQVWVADITYIRLRKEFLYLAVLMDVFTRCIRGWHLGRSLEQEVTMTALLRAFGGTPEIHHFDQGCSMRRRPTSSCQGGYARSAWRA